MMEEKEQQADRATPHVLCVQMGATQHAFEMDSREEAVKVARTALERGWVEIENDRVYLLVMAGPSSGVGFIIMSKSDVMANQLAAQRAQEAQRQAVGGLQQRLVLPGAR